MAYSSMQSRAPRDCRLALQAPLSCVVPDPGQAWLDRVTSPHAFPACRRMWKARLCFGSRPHKPKCALQVTNVTVPGGALLHPQAAVPITAVPAIFSTGAVNRTGLNGLTACGTTGLQTVGALLAWGCGACCSCVVQWRAVYHACGLRNVTNKALTSHGWHCRAASRCGLRSLSATSSRRWRACSTLPTRHAPTMHRGSALQDQSCSD